jgi:hypothetical protein
MGHLPVLKPTAGSLERHAKCLSQSQLVMAPPLPDPTSRDPERVGQASLLARISTARRSLARRFLIGLPTAHKVIS